MLVAAALSLFVHLAVAFERGDAVPTLHRIKVGEHASSWSPLAHRQLPRFGVDSVATVHAARDLAAPAPPRARCKLAVSFDERALEQPWLSFSSEIDDGAVLLTVDYEFAYAHHEIRGVAATPSYGAAASAATGEREHPPAVELRYRWKRSVEEDVGAMLHLLFAVVALAVLIILCSVGLTPERPIDVSGVDAVHRAPIASGAAVVGAARRRGAPRKQA